MRFSPGHCAPNSFILSCYCVLSGRRLSAKPQMVYYSERRRSNWELLPLSFRIRLPYCTLITARNRERERKRERHGRVGTRDQKVVERGGRKVGGGGEERKRQRKIGPLPSRVIITISEFSMKRQQVEPNGKYADVCKCMLDGSPRGPVGD